MIAWKFAGQSALMVLALALTGCGGGGGVASTPTPTPSPTPSPAPTPAPTPTPSPTPVSYNTAEYRNSDGPVFHGAITAWEAGASGAGTTIAIVDSGIDTANSEFAGRISSASADVAGSRGVRNTGDDHGTQVALVAAAARNDYGVMGIAWGATVQMLRADTPGTCASADGCTFSDTNIADGIDAAVGAGARVVNLSLGGEAADTNLRAAVARATSAGLIVVVSAGNDGQSTDPAIDPNNPDPFAVSLLQAGGGNVIIVGSVSSAGLVSDFSNRAGSSASSFLMAQGETICCVYEGSQIRVVDGFRTAVNGTSFAAPQVSGAVALLAQAFPNLTGAQIVSLLLSTAREGGAIGTDPIYGRGILDIARAFSPQGSTGLAGTSVAVSLDSVAGTTSGAMGDAVSGASLGTVMLDGYGRAYALDLGRGLRFGQTRQPLLEALRTGARPTGFEAGDVSLAFSVDRRFGAVPLRLAPGEREQARVLASMLVTRIGNARELALGWNTSSDALAARLQQRREAQFLVAGTANGMFERPELGFAARQKFGGVGVTVSGGRSLVWRPEALRDRREDRLARLGVAFDGRGGDAFDWRLGLGLMREERTVLGARFADALGGGGATTGAIEPGFAWRPMRGWHLGGTGSLGFTRVAGSSVAPGGSRLVSSSWAFDVARDGALVEGDRLGLRLSQPLRVESGGLALNLPVAWDYATQTARFGRVPLSLAPKGRELDAEVAWSARLWDGAFSASLFWRRDPGHFAAAPDDAGGAVRWTAGF